MASPLRVVAAIRTRLVSSTDLQVFVGSDTASTSARVTLIAPIDTAEPIYPLIVIFLEGEQQATWSPFTYDPGKLYIGCYSRKDQVEALKMEELVRNLLHTQKTAVSSSGACFHEIRKTWGDSGVYHSKSGTWCVSSRYLFRASVTTSEPGQPG